MQLQGTRSKGDSMLNGLFIGYSVQLLNYDTFTCQLRIGPRRYTTHKNFLWHLWVFPCDTTCYPDMHGRVFQMRSLGAKSKVQFPKVA